LVGKNSPLEASEKSKLENQIVQDATALLKKMNEIPYRIPIDEFQWGSNSDVADAAMEFAIAWKISKDDKFKQAVLETTDYLFGKNATGYSFVTGLGTKSTMHPHHRISASDGIEQPIPGLLAGGPNMGMQDKGNIKAQYDKYPAKCYLDITESFASNEVAINWNAPLVFVLGFLEMEMK
jgi:endoglucanase